MNEPLTDQNYKILCAEKGKTICSTNTVGGVHVHWGTVWLPLSGTGSDALGARQCCSMSWTRMGDRDIGYSHKQKGKIMMLRLVIATQTLSYNPVAKLVLHCKASRLNKMQCATKDVSPFTSIRLKSTKCNMFRYWFPIFVTTTHQVTQVIKSKSCRSQSCNITTDFFDFIIRKLFWIYFNHNITWIRHEDNVVRTCQKHAAVSVYSYHSSASATSGCSKSWSPVTK